MKFLLSLAWKNLSRYKRRTIITAAALAFGLGVYILMDSMLVGLEIDSERNLVRYETSSIRIMRKGYWEEKEKLSLKNSLDNPAALEAELNKLNYKQTAPRTVFLGEAIVSEDPYEKDGSMPVKVIAIDPAKDDEVFSFKGTVEAGRYLKENENGVLLGSWLAEDLGAKVGYPLRIATNTRFGQRQLMDMEVVGIINCPNPYINKGTVFMPLKTADEYLQMEGNVTEINIKLADYNRAPEVARSLQQQLTPLFPKIEVLDWKILAKDYVDLATMKKGGSSIMLLLVFIIAAVGVTNTMLMAVYERIRELGMMRAIGMTEGQIRVSFLLEATGIGFIGATAGVILGVLVNIPLVVWGWDMTDLFGRMDIGYRVAAIMRGVWHIRTIIVAFILGTLLTTLVAWIPTHKAIKMEITECLRHQ